MPRFDHVRLRNGLGWVSPARGRVAAPLDREAFTMAPGGDESAVPYHLVDTPQWIAVVPSPLSVAHAWEHEQRVTELLVAAGCVAVACLGAEAPGAVLVRAWGCGEAELPALAAAVWAVRVIAGWDEARLLVMTFGLWPFPSPADPSPMGRAITVSARGEVTEIGGSVDVRPARPGAARTFWELVAEHGGPSACGVALADVDEMKAYNDVYGLEAGHLAIARIGGALELLADDLGAIYMRVGGDEFALLVPEHGRAREIARAMELAVADLRLPFSHPAVKAGPLLSVTAVALDEPADLAAAHPFAALEDRLGQRKGARRASSRRR